MSCSKQDYEALARVLYKCKPGGDNDEAWDKWEEIIDGITAILDQMNPNFDANRFRFYCMEGPR